MPKPHQIGHRAPAGAPRGPVRLCPKCSSNQVTVDPATPGDSGEDYGSHTNDGTAYCATCGWTGWESQLAMGFNVGVLCLGLWEDV